MNLFLRLALREAEIVEIEESISDIIEARIEEQRLHFLFSPESSKTKRELKRVKSIFKLFFNYFVQNNFKENVFKILLKNILIFILRSIFFNSFQTQFQKYWFLTFFLITYFRL